jgi:prepilin-type processing-associated H-X9-DG protein
MGARHVTLAGALLRTVLWSAPLIFVPIVGPVLASWLGARRAAGAVPLVVGTAVACCWSGGLWWASGQSVTVSGTTVTLGPLAFVIPVVAAGFVAGGAFAAGGRARASAGLIVGVVGLGWSAYQVGPVWSLAKQLRPAPAVKAADPMCPGALKRLYTAARLYADSWDDTLPPAATWSARLAEFLPNGPAPACPAWGAASGEGPGYAMSDRVGGKAAGSFVAPGREPVFYDSATPGPSAHDPFASLPRPGRHAGANNVAYLDGHVAGVARP